MVRDHDATEIEHEEHNLNKMNFVHIYCVQFVAINHNISNYQKMNVAVKRIIQSEVTVNQLLCVYATANASKSPSQPIHVVNAKATLVANLPIGMRKTDKKK